MFLTLLQQNSETVTLKHKVRNDPINEFIYFILNLFVGGETFFLTDILLTWFKNRGEKKPLTNTINFQPKVHHKMIKYEICSRFQT